MAVVIVLSRIIASKIRANLSPRVAPYTHLFVALLGLYYLVDVLSNNSLFFHNLYFYFWVVIILSQIIFYLQAKKRIHE